MDVPLPVANGMRTDHPIPGLPFVDDSILNLDAPQEIENLGRLSKEGTWGRTDPYGSEGAWRAASTDQTQPGFAWFVVHVPQRGTSIVLTRDDDVAQLYGYRNFDHEDHLPLVIRAGGYWSDGTTWRRPTATIDPVTGEREWDIPIGSRSLTAADYLGTPVPPDGVEASPWALSITEFAATAGPRVPHHEWVKLLAGWAQRRGQDELPLNQCICDITAPELSRDALLSSAEAAEVGGVEASTWRSYLSREVLPDPQAYVPTANGGKERPLWSRPIVQAWAASRARSAWTPTIETSEHAARIAERMAQSAKRIKRWFLKDTSHAALRQVIGADTLGLAIAPSASAQMHALYMHEFYNEEWGLGWPAVEQILALMWSNPAAAEDALRRFVSLGLKRGLDRDLMTGALARLRKDPARSQVVDRAINPYWT